MFVMLVCTAVVWAWTLCNGLKSAKANKANTAIVIRVTIILFPIEHFSGGLRRANVKAFLNCWEAPTGRRLILRRPIRTSPAMEVLRDRGARGC